jgi:excisionase family DNA binding protein
VNAIHETLGKLYSVHDVSAALHVTARTILSYLKSGALRGRKVGGAWLISEANLKRFIEGE